MSVEDWPSIFDPSSCVRRGLCPVTEIRNTTTFESHSLYFEQHGTGPEKLVFVMGLNSSSFAWALQVAHFSRLPQYSVLVFDNRGVGYSGVPRGPFTTSAMAEDLVALLDYVGWKEPRGIHIIGLSLGGMIAQEVAYRIPERITSLTLGVTTPGGYPWTNFPPWKGVIGLLKATFTKDLTIKIPIIHDMVFTKSWLEDKDEEDPRRTNRERETEVLRNRINLTKPQTLLGTIYQMCAGLTHHVTPGRLRKISSSVPKVLLVTGDEDNLVKSDNTFYLKRHMPEAELVQWENTGHAIHYQRRREFNALIERIVKEGRETALQRD
ncbi:Alpha/Beta hydrolase protein [Desarmillaria tabescens]|uniref:Alpha/Beta hydrolase protein n=1 Tax=Armillaria tabescens TaxID=1929756 RepID=A0AA39JUZ1_ARMTA|nr:Alpha/Beta hydrolase protein [Desarmillaria tabescens]KAK0448316.1 Alpha/Beta hydrolase protein [Desarmillaria tabescens]